MGHAIQALLIRETAAYLVADALPHTRAISVGQGIRLVPITDATFDALRERLPDLQDPPETEFWKLSGPVSFVAQQLSHHGPVAYVETEYFGGTGEQAATVWDLGIVRMPPTKAESGPISSALRMMGVQAEPTRDEFDTADLGRNRSNEDWLERES